MAHLHAWTGDWYGDHEHEWCDAVSRTPAGLVNLAPPAEYCPGCGALRFKDWRTMDTHIDIGWVRGAVREPQPQRGDEA